MSENKYTPYTPQQPTDGIVGSRAFKRRLWKASWKSKFLAKSGKMNYNRQYRRMLWSLAWKKLNEAKG